MHRNGTSRHFAYLTLEQKELQLKLLVATLDLSIPITGLGKIAIGITILRIIGNTSNWQKWAIRFTIAVTFITGLIDLLFSTFRCGDPEVLWTLSRLAVAQCGVSERAANSYNDFTNGWQVFNDFLFSILPIFVVWKLKMPLGQRMGLAIALGLTLVTGAAAIAKAYVKATLDATDISWNLPELIIWFSTEAMLVISFGSVPSLTPLWKRYISRSQRGYQSKSYEADHRFGSSKRTNSSSQRTRNQASQASTAPLRHSSLELIPLTGHTVQAPAATAVGSGNAGRWQQDIDSDHIHVTREYDVSSGKEEERGGTY